MAMRIRTTEGTARAFAPNPIPVKPSVPVPMRPPVGGVPVAGPGAWVGLAINVIGAGWYLWETRQDRATGSQFPGLIRFAPKAPLFPSFQDVPTGDFRPTPEGIEAYLTRLKEETELAIRLANAEAELRMLVENGQGNSGRAMTLRQELAAARMGETQSSGGSDGSVSRRVAITNSATGEDQVAAVASDIDVDDKRDQNTPSPLLTMSPEEFNAVPLASLRRLSAAEKYELFRMNPPVVAAMTRRMLEDDGERLMKKDNDGEQVVFRRWIAGTLGSKSEKAVIRVLMELINEDERRYKALGDMLLELASFFYRYKDSTISFPRSPYSDTGSEYIQRIANVARGVVNGVSPPAYLAKAVANVYSFSSYDDDGYYYDDDYDYDDVHRVVRPSKGCHDCRDVWPSTKVCQWR